VCFIILFRPAVFFLIHDQHIELILGNLLFSPKILLGVIQAVLQKWFCFFLWFGFCFVLFFLIIGQPLMNLLLYNPSPLQQTRNL